MSFCVPVPIIGISPDSSGDPSTRSLRSLPRDDRWGSHRYDPRDDKKGVIPTVAPPVIPTVPSSVIPTGFPHVIPTVVEESHRPSNAGCLNERLQALSPGRAAESPDSSLPL